MLFNEPKLLKFALAVWGAARSAGFSALQRAEIAEIVTIPLTEIDTYRFSALQRAEIAEIVQSRATDRHNHRVSVLFNEPKLLKSNNTNWTAVSNASFSALQRAEIAEINAHQRRYPPLVHSVSVLFNEPKLLKSDQTDLRRQRCDVSVLFNEPKLLKSNIAEAPTLKTLSFSALQRAEIAEIPRAPERMGDPHWFQCSSTSRNC